MVLQSVCSILYGLRKHVAMLGVFFLSLVYVQEASALPSFARQTGQQCTACHNGFPELTPYGRQFKLNGYTFSNGQGPPLPIAGLIIASATNTSKDLVVPALPTTSRNNNVDLDAISLFYAGRITSHVGAYIQGAWSDLSHSFQLFNTDVRFANNGTLFGKSATYGLSVNNNPGIIDPWNTAQSFWSYPYEESHVVIPPIGTTALRGRYDLQVVGGTAYVSWNRWLYVAGGIYGGIKPKTLDSLGINTIGLNPIVGAAPYWRLAVEPAWGHSTLEVGTLGMAFSAAPRNIRTAGTDHTVDIGVDTQYQYLADHHSVSLMASYIHERSTYNASKALGFASNYKNYLSSFNAKGTYTYDQTYSTNLGYFQNNGSRDRLLYGGSSPVSFSPESSGIIGEIDYYPFNRGGPKVWRDLGVKVGLQYTYYTKFDGRTSNYDGAGRSASANNTLFLYTWVAF